MSKDVQIGNSIYKIPVYGENKWGENTTALLEALVNTVSNIVGPQDIPIKEATLSNNVSSPLPINGLKFDTSIVQTSVVNGVIVRTFPALLLIEPTQDTFVIEGTSFEGKVEYAVRYTGSDAKVNITGDDDGQFYYTSENVANTESLFVKFYGKAIVDTEA